MRRTIDNLKMKREEELGKKMISGVVSKSFQSTEVPVASCPRARSNDVIDIFLSLPKRKCRRSSVIEWSRHDEDPCREEL